MSTRTASILTICAVVALVVWLYIPQGSSAPVVEKYSLSHIEIADTQNKHVQGLSGRKEVPDDYGMLFIFEHAAVQKFWMKDMLVPIDIIWIDNKGRIVGAFDSVATSTYPDTFASPVPVKYVLETQAGLRIRRGWDVGTKLLLPIN